VSESVKLHHPRFANVNYVVELRQPMPKEHNAPCFACSRKGAPLIHANKSIHLRLDANGDVFVAPGILKLLRKVPTMAGLEVVPGRNAPPQLVGAVAQPTQDIVLAGQRFYVPGFNKYKAGERMQEPFIPVANAIAEKADRAAVAKRAEKQKTFIFGRSK
jgi:hypothetical protein